MIRHALRNASIPVLTVTGLELGQLLGGAAIVEVLFARRGLGSLLVDAVRFRDYPLVQGALLLFMALVLIVSLATDLIYGAADPRTRYE